MEDGSLDANYFQHITYLNNFNVEYGTSLVSAAEVHYEPFGIYAGKTASLDALQDGAQIAVPNDTTNEGRALLLLQDQGLITLFRGLRTGGHQGTTSWITPTTTRLWNWKPSCCPTTLQDVDIAVINGNYAIDAGLSVSDALATRGRRLRRRRGLCKRAGRQGGPGDGPRHPGALRRPVQR